MSRAALVGFVLLASSAAQAQTPDKQGGIVDPFAKQRASHSDPASKKRAAELSAQAAQHYKRGEFEVSAALLRQAYALYAEPNLLYNLARSLEGMGDKQGAVNAFDRYLATGKDIEDRGAIERRVSLLRRELIDQRGDPVREPVPAAAPAPVVAEPPRTAERVTPPSKLPWIPIVGGVAMLGAGVGFGMRARDFEQQANEEVLGADARDAYEVAQSNATVANVAFAVGGAVLAGGIVWEVIVLRRQSKKSDVVSVRPTLGGHGVALEWALP
jgi:tetratricopeptide (TPR) repeat protein